MSSGPSGWLPLVFATLGAGVTGSLIATYGSQAAERRKARSGVIASLQKLENARRQRVMQKQFDFSENDLAELETQCVLARLPRYLVATYRLANEVSRSQFDRDDITFDTPSAGRLHRYTRVLCDLLIERSAEQLVANVWHPWLTALYIRRRNRNLLKALHEIFPTSARSTRYLKHSLATWRHDREKVRKQSDRKWQELEEKWQRDDPDGPAP